MLALRQSGRRVYGNSILSAAFVYLKLFLIKDSLKRCYLGGQKEPCASISLTLTVSQMEVFPSFAHLLYILCKQAFLCPEGLKLSSDCWGGRPARCFLDWNSCSNASVARDRLALWAQPGPLHLCVLLLSYRGTPKETTVLTLHLVRKTGRVKCKSGHNFNCLLHTQYRIFISTVWRGQPQAVGSSGQNLLFELQ